MLIEYVRKIHQINFFKYFTIALRIGLGLSFIWPSIPKILGHRFTLLSPETEIGFFFEALYQTGLYWHFLGVSQFTAGLLLLIPRTSAIGAIVFFPIILNIFIITISLPFQGTPFVTTAMLLGGGWLLIWEYDRLKFLFVNREHIPTEI